MVEIALCQVGGRGAGVEGPCGAEVAEVSKEKRLKLFPGSWEGKAPLLRCWGKGSLRSRQQGLVFLSRCGGKHSEILGCLDTAGRE